MGQFAGLLVGSEQPLQGGDWEFALWALGKKLSGACARRLEKLGGTCEALGHFGVLSRSDPTGTCSGSFCHVGRQPREGRAAAGRPVRDPGRGQWLVLDRTWSEALCSGTHSTFGR